MQRLLTITTFLAFCAAVFTYDSNMDEIFRLTGRSNADLISEAALGAIGSTSSLYGVALQTEHLDYGNLACATVVSAILRKAGFLDKIHAGCKGLLSALKNNGWTSININDSGNFKAGDVIFFHYGNPDRPRHTGVIAKKGGSGGWIDVENASIGSFNPYSNRVIESGITSAGKHIHTVLRVPDSTQPDPHDDPSPEPHPEPQPDPDFDDTDFDDDTDSDNNPYPDDLISPPSDDFMDDPFFENDF